MAMASPRGGGGGGAEEDGGSPSMVEEVNFDEPNGRDGFAIRPEARQIRLHSSPQLSDPSPFHFNTIVDYTWETQYQHGRLIATHISSLFIAYVVKVSNAGAVRVIDMESKERVLMKGEKGAIKDVDFMHKMDDVILGFIDEYGTFYINKIVKEMKTGKLSAHPILRVNMDDPPIRADIRRFIWCKYVPDEHKEVASPKDCAYHFVVLENEMIYAGNLVQLVQNQGEGTHTLSEIRHELLPIETHSAPVTDASFAPDGTALATSSKDGSVNFYQIYFHERSNPARCLYSWSPHDGRPIDRMFFLDNYSLNREGGYDSQYWKYMVIAADSCSELKLFTCKSWQCLQTLKLSPSSKGTQWKIEVDLGAKYIMATEIHSKAMYLIHMEFNNSDARFNWIQEYSMPWNTIGFNISSAATIRFGDAISKGLGPSIIGDHGTYKKDDVLHLVEINVVQPRSMQQGSVAHLAPANYPRCRSGGPRRISFNRSIDLKEFVDPDEPLVPSDQDAEEVGSQNAGTKKRPNIPTSPNLIKDIRTAAEMTEQLNSLIGVSPAALRASSNRSPREKSPSPNPPRQSIPFAGEQERRTNGSASKTSTSSSPSREVEEILSPKGAQNFGTKTSGISLEEAMIMNAEITFENGNVPGLDQQYSSNKRSSLKNAAGDIHSKAILEKLSGLTDIIESQAKDIRELKQAMGHLTLMHREPKEQNDGIYNRILEQHLKHTQHQFSRIEELMKTVEKQNQASMNAAIPQNLADVLATSIATLVNKELQNIVPQALSHQFDPARLNIATQIDRLTSVVEAKLAQNINQIMQRDRIWQTLTNTFQSTVKTVFDSTFNDLFMTSVFPRCQTAVQEMLIQVSDAFSTGTKEYLAGLEGVLERERKREDFQELVSTQMVNMQDALTSALQVEIEAQMLRVLGGIQGGVVKQLEEFLTRELTRNFQDQQRYLEMAVVPRGVTPAISVCESVGGLPVTDARVSKRRVLDMASNGDMRGAFMLASSQGDADVLIQLCKSYNASVLQELNLPSSVHLSIMQILASDIVEDSDVKIDYLNMSIMCLDMNEPKIQKGLSRLVPVYQAAVSKFEDRNPNSSLLPRIKVLQMAFGRAPQNVRTSASLQSSVNRSFQY